MEKIKDIAQELLSVEAKGLLEDRQDPKESDLGIRYLGTAKDLAEDFASACRRAGEEVEGLREDRCYSAKDVAEILYRVLL